MRFSAPSVSGKLKPPVLLSALFADAVPAPVDRSADPPRVPGTAPGMPTEDEVLQLNCLRRLTKWYIPPGIALQ